MKELNSQIIKNISDLALDVVNKSEVHTAYNRRGELSHFVVMVPRDEFFKLYSMEVDVNVFVEGRWVQFGFSRESGKMLSQHSGAVLTITFRSDPILRSVKVTFLHMGKKVYGCTINKCTLSALLETTFGMQKLAHLGCRALRKLENSPEQAGCLEEALLPLILVIPEKTKSLEFNRNLVELQ